MGKICQDLKIIFLGTPEFGAIILGGLIKKGLRPILVITSPDKPVGRKKILTPPPVKILAKKEKISISQPESISDLKTEILKLKPDLLVVCAYGQILPKEILQIPKYGCLNVHASLLPKYRGASPIQAAILNGDKETGITIILMDEKMDHGPILAKSKIKIKKKIRFGELEKTLAELGAKLLLKAISSWVEGKIKPQIQDEKKASYTKILKKEDGKIDWKKPAQEIERMIRAYDPWPSAYCFFENKILKIWEASVLKSKEAPPGKVFLVDQKLAVSTGKDALLIEELQPEGKRKMRALEFLRGHPQILQKTLS